MPVMGGGGEDATQRLVELWNKVIHAGFRVQGLGFRERQVELRNEVIRAIYVHTPIN
jgi:hypothetical protein